LRPSKRERYGVTIFGSARAKPGTFVYDEVKRVAGALAEMGCDIITGGGPGLMQAANEGAAAAHAPERNRSLGIRVDLPFDTWAEFVDWARKFLLRPELSLASPEDLKIPSCVNTADEAIALLRQHHAKWATRKMH
jgi:hypothetical protein